MRGAAQCVTRMRCVRSMRVACVVRTWCVRGTRDACVVRAWCVRDAWWYIAWDVGVR